jgi:hypothetical protein
MSLIKSVFIVEPDDQGWIIERLMRELVMELEARGIAARIGVGKEYKGEEVVFNSRYLTPMHDQRARVNSLFITHVDDKLKEWELRSTFPKFDSHVCISPEDADFVAALKGSRAGVVGIELPTRETRVRPIRLAMFSARYEDGRKNERWILEYFRERPPEVRGSFVFSFLGWGWESFCAQLGELEMNYEIYRYSRFMPGEYEIYKEILPGTDALIYLGFDGGAMSVYDALAAGISVIASDTSYHRGLGPGVTLFATREEFFAQLDRLHEQYAARVASLRSRAMSSYADRLVAHWESLVSGSGGTTGTQPPAEQQAQTLDKFRSNYKRVGLSRLRSVLIRWAQTRMIRS